MAYVPNASDVTQPTGDKAVASAAPEFRGVKGLLGTAIAGQAGFQAQLDAILAALSGGTSSVALAALLASANGSNIVGFLQEGLNAVYQTLQSKGRQSLSVRDWGADYKGVVAADTAFANTAIAAKLLGRSIALNDGNYKLTGTWVLNAFNGLTIYSDGASLIGPSSGTLSCLVEIKNSQGCSVNGTLGIAGSYNTGLGCGIWVHADAGSSSCNLMDFRNVQFSGCKLAWRFGDIAYPEKVVSEINIFGGYTYGCPCVIQVEGAQTIVNTQGTNLISDYGGGAADPTWNTITQTTCRVIGGYLRMSGGELVHASNNQGSAVDVQPVNSAPSNNTVGKFIAVNVHVESASQLAISSNPAAIATPTLGTISFQNCQGFHSLNSVAFVQTGVEFATGILSFQGNDFYCSVNRTLPNIQCASLTTQVYCDEQSFGKNFLSNIRGISGGTAKFRDKLILSLGTPNHSVTSGVMTILKYQSSLAFDDSVRFSPGYDIATGRWTVVQPLTDVEVNIGFIAGAATPTDCYIYLNGVQTDSGMSVTGLQSFNCYIKSLAAGDILDLRCQPNGANITPTPNNLNHFKVMASA